MKKLQALFSKKHYIDIKFLLFKLFSIIRIKNLIMDVELVSQLHIAKIFLYITLNSVLVKYIVDKQNFGLLEKHRNKLFRDLFLFDIYFARLILQAVL